MARKTKPNVPDHIVIGGHTIPVVFGDVDGDDWGEFKSEPMRIDLNARRHTEHPDLLDSTLFHEAWHAAAEISGLTEILTGKQEEAIAKCLERLMWPLLQWRGSGE